MVLAAYALVVSLVYAVTALAAPEVAAALTVLFVALIVVPGVVVEWRDRRPGGRP